MNHEKISPVTLVKFLVSTVLNLKLNVIKFDAYTVALDHLEPWQTTMMGIVKVWHYLYKIHDVWKCSLLIHIK